jgi:hypothetical protein
VRVLASTKERKPLSDYEVVVPLAAPRGRARTVTRVRSTLITASLVALRQMGFEERYYQALPKERHEDLHSLVAGSWVPLEIAMLHYTACDKLGLTAAEMTLLGEDVSQRTQKSFVATLAKASIAAGVSPWVLFSNAHRIWERVFEGGDIASYKLGPKEAYVEVAGCPLLALPYFRAAFRAYFRAVVALLSQVAYTHEVVAYGSESGAVFRFSWA